MAEATDVLAIAAGPSAVAVWELGKWLVVGRLKKGEKIEEQNATDDRTKLDTVLSVVTKMERELALLAQQLSTHSGTVNEVKARVDGMSLNYGTRLSQFEKDIVELRVRLIAIEDKPKRGRR